MFHTGTVFGITCLRGEALVHGDNKMLIFYLFELDLSVDIGTYANAGRLCIFLVLSEGVILKNAHGDFEGTTGGRKFNVTKKIIKSDSSFRHNIIFNVLGNVLAVGNACWIISKIGGVFILIDTFEI